jgi:hypothetical protein
MNCRHCSKPRRVNERPRGLCWRCYYTPGVREHYPSTSKYAVRGVGAGVNPNRPASAPTDTAPGSEGRIKALEERAALGQCLWHPEDATT